MFLKKIIQRFKGYKVKVLRKSKIRQIQNGTERVDSDKIGTAHLVSTSSPKFKN